jgi:Putative zinc-finger
MNALPDPFIDYDAAYVMGALDPHDRRAFETHLSGCARCTTAVSELAGMPGLLAQVPPEQVLNPNTTAGPVPDTLLPRMAAALRRERRRRRVWGGVLGSAAAAALIVGIVLTTGALSPNTPAALSTLPTTTPSATSPPSTPTPTAPATSPSGGAALTMTSVRPVPVTATIRLASVAWGTRVNLSCTYLDDDEPTTGPPKKWTYRLVVVPRDGGHPQQVAQWTAIAGRTETPTGSTDLHADQILDIRLLNSRGDTLLHVTPPIQPASPSAAGARR